MDLDTIKIRFKKKSPFLYKIIYFFYISFGIKSRSKKKREEKLQKNGREVLMMAKKVLENNNIDFWLDFGTLLGAFREGGFIKADEDVDIGVFLEDYSVDIEEKMKKNGFRKIRQYEIDGGKYGLEQTYEYKGTSLDIFYYSMMDKNKIKTHCFIPFENYSYAGSIQKKGGLRVVEQYLPFYGLEIINFLGENFNAPKNIEKYLAFHYGKDFMTPKSWDYTNLKDDNINAKILYNKIGVVQQLFI